MFEDFDIIPESEIPQSRAALKKVLKSRGWKNIEVLYTNKFFINATRPDGKNLRFVQGIPPTVSYGAVTIAKDKYATYAYLRKLPDVKQPATVLLKYVDDAEKEESLCRDLINEYRKIVLKPLNGAHGNDVFMNIGDVNSAKIAIQTIRKHTEGTPIIAEQQIESKKDYRVICINYHFVAAFSRTPAEVAGDGKHTVAELIDLENATIRKKAYYSDLAKIKKSVALSYLGQKQNEVPKIGEKVKVVPVCNTGQGGTIEETTDIFPEELKRLSEKVARHLELPLIGIDFIDDYIIEVNAEPNLYHKKDGTCLLEKLVEYFESI